MISAVPLTTEPPASGGLPQPQTLEEIQRKRRLAEALMNEGTSYAPVGHWTQALARVAGAAVGGMNAEAARRDQQGMNKSAAEALLGLYQGGQNALPGAGSVASAAPAPPQQQPSPLPGPTAATPGLLADDVAGPRMAGLSGMAQNLLPEQQAQPQGMMGLGGPLPPDLVSSVKQSEGFAPRAQWDYKQHTNGYGTRAKMPGEVIDQAEAETRLSSELGKAYQMVQEFAPDAPLGVKKALASLTFNAGPGWMNAGLGQAVKAGNWQEAKARFQQYVKAGGQTLPGLVDRRNRESKWFNELQGQSPQQPAQVADASGQFVDRATLQKLIENPQTREMGQKLLMQDMQRRQPLSQMDQADLELKKAQTDSLRTKSTTPPKMSPTELKELWESEDRLGSVDNTIQMLQRAKELSAQAYTSIAGQYGSGVLNRTGLGNEASRATEELDTILGTQAISRMSEQLKGATTDREMQKFIALAGSSQLDPKLREQLIDNAIKEFEAGQKIRRQRIEQIKSRNYSPNASPGVQGGTYTYNPATGELEPQ